MEAALASSSSNAIIEPRRVTVNNAHGPIAAKRAKLNNPVGEAFAKQTLKRIREKDVYRKAKNARLTAENATIITNNAAATAEHTRRTRERTDDTDDPNPQPLKKLNKLENESIAFRWLKLHDRLIPPSAYGYDRRLLNHSRVKALNRARTRQGTKYNGKKCPLPGCGRLFSDILHSRTACQNKEQSAIITSNANKQVWAIAKAIAKGELGRWKILINAGLEHAPANYTKEEHTTPDWMLPGTPSKRGFPDKPDLCLVIGLDIDAPPPSTKEERSECKLVILEVATSNDFYLVDAQNRKRSKYVELVRALREYGWNVITEQGLHFNEWYLQYTHAKDDTTDKIDAQGVITQKRVFTDITPEIEEGEIFIANEPIFTCIISACGFHLTHSYHSLEAVRWHHR